MLTYFTDKMDIFRFGVLRWVQINTESAAEPSNLSLQDVRNIFIFLHLFSLPLFWWRAWGSDKYNIMNYGTVLKYLLEIRTLQLVLVFKLLNDLKI